jgi:hypothetical protein
VAEADQACSERGALAEAVAEVALKESFSGEEVGRRVLDGACVPVGLEAVGVEAEGLESVRVEDGERDCEASDLD